MRNIWNSCKNYWRNGMGSSGPTNSPWSYCGKQRFVFFTFPCRLISSPIFLKRENKQNHWDVKIEKTDTKTPQSNLLLVCLVFYWSSFIREWPPSKWGFVWKLSLFKYRINMLFVVLPPNQTGSFKPSKRLCRCHTIYNQNISF